MTVKGRRRRATEKGRGGEGRLLFNRVRPATRREDRDPLMLDGDLCLLTGSHTGPLLNSR